MPSDPVSQKTKEFVEAVRGLVERIEQHRDWVIDKADLMPHTREVKATMREALRETLQKEG